MPIFWRLFAAHAAVVVAAVLVLVLTPASVSDRATVLEVVLLVAGALVALAVEVIVLRRALRPLEELRDAMSAASLPSDRATPIAVGGRTAEVDELAAAFNAMLDRLDRERRDSGRRTIAAQEAERRRIGLELHDEIGQLLTGVLLQLQPAAGDAPADARQERAQQGVHDALDAIREITRGLRPDALEDLGLRSALTALASSAADRSPVHVTRRIAGGSALPDLPDDVELAIYRVAQESLTNVLRHSEAHEVALELGCEPDAGGQVVVLRVVDDGRGLPPAGASGSRLDGSAGSGLEGMRERAAAIGATLSAGPGDGGRGTAVELRVAVR
ncbi:histidine kinase [Paraconexibacter sp. AEG42_29]|uniref:HAMP domain-containing sensor histidine kinase n=1 Tax=Paraconexibacter sp. AEG42_29 TaxID=2997339 RepID=UPI00339D7AC1